MSWPAFVETYVFDLLRVPIWLEQVEYRQVYYETECDNTMTDTSQVLLDKLGGSPSETLSRDLAVFDWPRLAIPVPAGRHAPWFGSLVLYASWKSQC